MLVYSEDNYIYTNHFINNYEENERKSQAFDEGMNNIWYNPVTNRGNYWSDYKNGEYEIDGYADVTDPYPQMVVSEAKNEGLLFLLPLVVMSIFNKRKGKESIFMQ